MNDFAMLIWSQERLRDKGETVVMRDRVILPGIYRLRDLGSGESIGYAKIENHKDASDLLFAPYPYLVTWIGEELPKEAESVR